MQRAKKIVLWIAGLGLVAFLLAAGAWLYATSNVEVPAYVVAEQDGEIELRDYPELLVAEITTQGPRDTAVRAGFSPLAGYIFARERQGEKIAMTAPVTQRPDGEDTWTVQFIMPAGYTLDTLPTPASADVRLAIEPAIRRAAIRFSGRWDDAAFARHETLLRDWLAARGLVAQGPAIFAYYNDPLTPGFLRRNEVILDLGPAG